MIENGKILVWDTPPKAMSTQDWNNISADSAPPGVYTPNMSDEDMDKWKAKLIGVTTEYPRVEIRKATTALMLIIVSLGQGFKQKYKSMPEGANIQVSTNGASAFTWDEWQEFNQAIQEAREALEGITNGK